MKKFVVLATNDVPKYMFYTPLVCWAWRKFDWEPVLFYHRTSINSIKYSELICDTFDGLHSSMTAEMKNLFQLKAYHLSDQNGYKSETISQVSRLFGCCVQETGMLMTTDIDMLPLSDYWHPKDGEITSYGRDLTEYHYPICYQAMNSDRWEDVMDISSTNYNAQIRKVLRQQNQMWTLDQDIITERLLSYKNKTVTHIDRGTDKRTGYPIGRVDRSAWTLDHKVFIDAHLPHDILTNEKSYQKVMNLLHHIWPTENFKWFEEYYRDFKKLIA